MLTTIELSIITYIFYFFLLSILSPASYLYRSLEGRDLRIYLHYFAECVAQ